MSEDLPAQARKVVNWCLGWDMYELKNEKSPKVLIFSLASA